jgi:UbiD family decarboxylase
MGYAKVVIVVDETVDPFDLKQVMWALSTKFHPAHDLIVIPDASVLPLDPGSSPPGDGAMLGTGQSELILRRKVARGIGDKSGE